MLSLKNINFFYKKNKNFKFICKHFKAERGKITCIIGGNGSGKTTFLKLIARKLQTIEGEILFNGDDSRKIPLKKWKKDIVGIIDTSIFSSLVNDLSVFDHIVFALYASGKNIPFLFHLLDEDIFSNINETSLCELFNLMKRLKDQKISSLSTGQQQILSIILPMIQIKEILTSDESTSNLDVYYSRLFFEQMKKLAEKRNMISIMVTHDIISAVEFGDNIYSIVDGNMEKIEFKSNRFEDKVSECIEKISNTQVPNANSK